MGQEIERKYLVAADDWHGEVKSSTHIVQGYLTTQAKATVRVRIRDERAYLTIKGQPTGIARAEYEYEIPAADARAMLADLAEPGVIDKRRNLVPYAGYLWEVDVFSGANEGLVMAEVELSDPDEDPQLPSWVGAEVTDDPRYLNSSLSQRPFTTW